MLRRTGVGADCQSGAGVLKQRADALIETVGRDPLHAAVCGEIDARPLWAMSQTASARRGNEAVSDVDAEKLISKSKKKN